MNQSSSKQIDTNTNIHQLNLNMQQSHRFDENTTNNQHQQFVLNQQHQFQNQQFHNQPTVH